MRKTKFICNKPVVLKNIYVPNVELNRNILELATGEKYLALSLTKKESVIVLRR